MKPHTLRSLCAGAAVTLGVALPTIASATANAASMRAMPSVTTDFGPACSAVPKSGSGSFAGMTAVPVAMAASNNPVLSTLVTAVKKAGLVDTLDNAQAITVFAPDNAAFAKIPNKALSSLLANKAELTRVLEYHVVGGRLSPAQLPGVHKTIEGGTLSVTGGGTTFKINGTSQVVCGNVQTANATVYIIGHVLSLPLAHQPHAGS
jgi:uncharacterized surface protein with fasciclin (FAS1) repeats